MCLVFLTFHFCAIFRISATERYLDVHLGVAMISLPVGQKRSSKDATVQVSPSPHELQAV